MELVAQKIAADITGIVRIAEPLSRHTSFKIGGPADLYIEPGNPAELVYVLKALGQAGFCSFIMGNGSNLLVHDDGYRGAVIHLSGQFKEYHFSDLGVVCGAAVPLAVLAKEACRRGLRGLEFAAGIPGTVGGALVMNAGAHGSSIGDLLVEARILTGDLQVHTFAPEDLGLSYRKSNISPDQVVCFMTLQFVAGDKEELKRQCREDALFRRDRQPRQPNAGSIFKNPPGDTAGRLIEAVGLKGYRVGGAMISDRHANFIVNDSKASAQDVMTLVETARSEVYRKFGIVLELEVRLLGY